MIKIKTVDLVKAYVFVNCQLGELACIELLFFFTLKLIVLGETVIFPFWSRDIWVYP